MIGQGLLTDDEGRAPARSSAEAPPLAVARWVRPQLVVNVLAVGLGGAAAALLLEPAAAVLASLWWIAAVAVIRSDLDRFIIPDRASAAIAALGLVAVLVGGAGPGAGAVASAVAEALMHGALALGVFWFVAWAYRARSGRDGLGFGDVKLAGASGVWLGFGQQAVALELACVAAIAAVLLMRRGSERRAAVPFGAFLAPSAWLVFVTAPVAQDLFGWLA